MAVGFPAKTDFTTGEVLTAAQMNDVTGTLNLVSAQGNANLIAGGSFDIWQRGTTAFTTNNVYTSDRFFVFSSANYSLTQETSVIPEGATNAVKITSTAGSSFANMQFALEQSEVEKLAGKTVTFSVYLRANATYNGTTNVTIKSNTTGNTQTGGTWTTVTGATTIVTPSTSAYTRVTVTGTIPTTAKGLAFLIGQQSVLASGSILYIALAKAELGAVTTPFIRAGVTLAEELAACQRYYYRTTPGATGGALTTTAYAFSSTVANSTTSFPVTMRITPTSIDTSNIQFVMFSDTAYAMTSLVLNSITTNQIGSVYGTIVGGTGGQVGRLSASSAAGYLGFSAEL